MNFPNCSHTTRSFECSWLLIKSSHSLHHAPTFTAATAACPPCYSPHAHILHQRYVFAAVLDGVTGDELAGYGVGDTVPMEDVDGLRLPLKWRGRSGTTIDTSPLAGKLVRLRIYFRDATVFAVGA